MRTHFFAIVFASVTPVAVCDAQVALDGSSGQAGGLTGPRYVVTSDLGQSSGTNLFFSFDQFSLRAGESAKFVGPSATANVISRVTGGLPSSIDGLIDTRSSMPSANFFLLNPSGIVFGANAKLNVGGSFHSITAGSLNAKAAQILSLAFDSGAGGNISVTADDATFEAGDVLSLNAGTGTQRGGDIVLSVRGTLEILGTEILSELDGGAAGGNITIENADLLKMKGGAIQTLNTLDAGQGGHVSIRVRDMELTGTALIASSGPGAGSTGKLAFELDGSALIDDGTSISSISRTGLAGDIELKAGSVNLTGEASIQAGSFGSAQGGSIVVTAGSVSISDLGGISSQAAIANVGPVTVTSGSLSLDNGYISTSTRDKGRAGDIVLNVRNLSLTNGGQIASASLNPARGAAGSIVVSGASSVTISGSSPSNTSPIPSLFSLQDARSGIFTSAQASGPGGDITIGTRQLALRQGGGISASSSGPAAAGNVRIVFAEMLSMDRSAITTSSRSADGGGITITSTGSTLFLNNSQITTSVQTALGNGGRITLGSAVHPLGALILANSLVQANAIGGAGGDIGVFADVFLNDGSQLSAFSAQSRPGTIDVQARFTDVSSSLVQLPEGLLQAQNLLRASCAARTADGRTSSLVVAGREGVPPQPGGLLSSPLDSLVLGDPVSPGAEQDDEPLTQYAGVWAGSNCAR